MTLQHNTLRPHYNVSQIIKGGWQLAGGHGSFDRQQAISDMLTFIDHGITTFDCADIYTGVEELIGEAVKALKQRDGFDPYHDIQIHTKLVPDLARLDSITGTELEAIIDRSLNRLNLDCLHLVQIYWWDMTLGNPLTCFDILKNLQAKGKIRYVGCTNWDQHTMQQFVDHEFDFLSAQVQYSLLDNRPEGDFAQWCQHHDVSIFCYGVLAGGFITQDWLDRTDPGFAFENRSLIKYRLIIDEFGGWDLFQTLLQTLHTIALELDTDLSSVATRYMLNKPGVGATIIGAKTAKHIPSALSALNLSLKDHHTQQIDAVLNQRQGPSGDVYALEKDRNGRHGKIMKYNLNN